ncbi:MAG: lipopolysaccharide heptosyltransferase II [Chloroflexota bacterium]
MTTRLTLLLAWVFRRLMRPPSLERLGGPAPRILVLKPCCLGDVIMTTPALAALHAGLPRARITYGVSRYALPAIASSPLVARVLDVGPVGTSRPRSWAYVRGYVGLWAALRGARFDACLVFDRSPLLAVLPWLAGIPLRGGIDSAGRGFALNLRVPWSETLHESDLYLRVAALFGVPIADAALQFTPSAADDAEAARVWAQLSLDHRGPAVALASGGGVNPGMTLEAKRWPAERYGALGARLVDSLGATLLLVGGPSDRPVHVRVTAAVGAPGAVYDLAGRLSLGALGALLRRCDLFVGNDSAPMHVAAAVGCPVVALFGPTDPTMYAPYSARAIVVRADASPDSPRIPTMEGIAVERVLEACLKLLGRAS